MENPEADPNDAESRTITLPKKTWALVEKLVVKKGWKRSRYFQELVSADLSERDGEPFSLLIAGRPAATPPTVGGDFDLLVAELANRLAEKLRPRKRKAK